MKRNFYYMDGHSSKFWSIELVGIGYKIEYGTFGSNPGTSEKTFKDEQTAENNFEKQIKGKLNKYYNEGDPGEFSISGKIHEAVKRYNWDDGYATLRKIIKHKECDKRNIYFK